MADFYKSVPKELKANLAYRLELRKKAAKDPGLRRAIMAACKHDILYFLNAWCIAEDTPVLTLRGAVPIQDVTSSDLVWDGEQWVSQLGAVYKGTKEVIDAYEISLTPEHKVWTTHGWQRADCGYDRQEIRAPGSASIRRKVRQHEASRMALPVRLRERSDCLREPPSQAVDEKLRVPQKGRKAANARANELAGLRSVVGDAREVQKSQQQIIPPVWRSRDLRMREVEGLCSLHGGHGAEAEGDVTRPDQQRRQLRAGKLPVGDGESAIEQHSQKPLHRNVARAIDSQGSVRDCGNFAGSDALPHEAGGDGRWSDRAAPSRSARVYDLVNCGPRRAFTVIDREGNLLLVHNCYIIEPRTRFDERGHKKAKVFPFLTWEHQDYWFPKVYDALGVRNVTVEKCRGEGWTWFECMAALKDFLFEEDTLVGLVSSTEEKSDSPSLGSILGKIDWEMTKLPTWMTGIKGRNRNDPCDWYRNSNQHAFVNLKRGTQITAFAAGPDVGRGDRFTWFGLDEHASDEWKAENNDEKVLESLGGTTDSILSISTPKGAFGAFHRLVHAPSATDLKVTIDWRDNPTKNRGLYKLVNDRPVAVDPVNNPMPEEYQQLTKGVSDMLSRLRKRGYDLESKSRSPWLDRECDRGTSTPQNVAQEIERDYGGSVARIFGGNCILVAEESCRTPEIYGNLSVYDDLTYSFDRMDNGSFLLWTQLDLHDKPPKHQYVVCADVASGDGGDYCNNSAVIVIDLNTGEQVLEYVTKTVKPPDLADKSIAIATWFNNALLAWESMGPGTSFTKQVIERGYANCYERETMDRSTKKRTRRLGFDNRFGAREALFGDLERQIRTGGILVRSKFLVEELGQYIRNDKGKIQHVSVSGEDSSHGDRVIALGVGVQAMKSRPLPQEIKKEQDENEPIPGTLAYREWAFNKMNAAAADEWDDRSTSDFRGGSKELAHF